MLKKSLTCAAVTGAAALAVTGLSAAPAAASDTIGGDYSQNLNLIPHPCIDVDDINALGALDVSILNDNDAIQCDELSTGAVKYHEDKGPLSDLIDAGAGQH